MAVLFSGHAASDLSACTRQNAFGRLIAQAAFGGKRNDPRGTTCCVLKIKLQAENDSGSKTRQGDDAHQEWVCWLCCG